jgi:hypothetical protein
MPTTIGFVASLLAVAGLAFLTGWKVRGRRAEAEMTTWHYAMCGAFIGLRRLFDRNDESLRDYLTSQARIYYGVWHAGRRVNPPPFSPSTDELFRIADREFSSEFAAAGAAA